MWGQDASVYVGRRLRLYRDPDVSFGTEKTGGTRISHASHLSKKVTLSLPKSKGRFSAHTVEPLPESPRVAQPTPNEPTAEQVAACTDINTLRTWHGISGPKRQAQILARRNELTAPPNDAA